MRKMQKTITLKSLPCLLVTAMLTLSGICARTQALTVTGIEGDVYVRYVKNGKEHYNKMVYGPVANADKVILKDGSKLRLVNDKNMICSLDKPGDYKVAELPFTTPENTPLFANFIKYFKSFFGTHDNPESKANYKNTIFAISRGKEGSISPDFPMAGILPYGRLGGMPFYWTHECEKCSYTVRVYDMETKKEVFGMTTDKHSLDMKNSDNILRPGKKYYWEVSETDKETASAKVYFQMSNGADFEEKISGLKSEADYEGNSLGETARNIYILSQLEEEGLINYAVLYGLYLRSAYPSDDILGNVVDRLWYDHLMKQ